MNVNFYATRIQAQVMSNREIMELSYERFPDETRYWCMIDLVDSSNFRIAQGPKEGYIRGETFFSLIRDVITPVNEIRLIKEIGDSVLLSSASFRPIFESLIMIDQVAHQMAAIAGTDIYPLAIRGAINFGHSKRLLRPSEDFIGTSIDLLSRLMRIRSDIANLIIHEDAFQTSVDIVSEYAAFVEPSKSKMLTEEYAKDLQREVFYRELVINRDSLLDFREHFVPWRNERFPGNNNSNHP